MVPPSWLGIAGMGIVKSGDEEDILVVAEMR